MTRYSRWLAVLAGLLILLSIESAARAPDGGARGVTLFFTGLIRGSYGPCGCNTEPSGGFARRSAYATRYAAEHGVEVIHVDSGGILLPRGPDAAVVNPAMLDAIRDLPVQVVNLSPHDLFLWDEVASSDLSDRFISTNLSPLDPQRATPARYRIVKASAGGQPVSIGFLGISDPATVKPNSGFRGLDPLQAIREVKEKVLEQADFLVVLADIPQRPDEQILDRLAGEHKEIAAILATEDQYRLHEPRIVNHAVILSSVERGRYLGQLELTVDKNGAVQDFSPEFIQMGEEQPQDEHFLRIQQSLLPYLPQ